VYRSRASNDRKPAEVDVIDIRTSSRKMQFVETAKIAVGWIAGHELRAMKH
jgi:hypothetical protein